MTEINVKAGDWINLTRWYPDVWAQVIEANESFVIFAEYAKYSRYRHRSLELLYRVASVSPTMPQHPSTLMAETYHYSSFQGRYDWPADKYPMPRHHRDQMRAADDPAIPRAWSPRCETAMARESEVEQDSPQP